MFNSVFKFCFNYKHFFSFSFVVFAWPKAKNPKGSVLTMTMMSGCLRKSPDSNSKMTTRLPFKVRIRASYPAFFHQDYFLRCLPLLVIDTTPARTHSMYKWTKISSLEIDIFDLKMMVKCGLEFFLKKFSAPLQSCCCPVQKYLPRMAELAWQLSRYL